MAEIPRISAVCSTVEPGGRQSLTTPPWLDLLRWCFGQGLIQGQRTWGQQASLPSVKHLLKVYSLTIAAPFLAFSTTYRLVDEDQAIASAAAQRSERGPSNFGSVHRPGGG